MVGPSLEGLGGISRVVALWEEGGLFQKHNIFYIPTRSVNSIADIIYLIKSLLRFSVENIKNYKAVYIHTSSGNSFFRKSIFIITTIFSNKKVILHVHPTHFYEFINNEKKIKSMYINTIMKRVDVIIVLSNDLKQKLCKKYPEKKIHLLRNPVNIERMKVKNHIKRKLNSLIYLGWFVKSKGVYDLVDAIKLIVDSGNKVHLDFYGTKEVRKLRSYVANKKLNDYITVHDWIDFDDKLQALYSNSALVLPSYSEGIPNVVLEAMATKIPVISTYVGGLKEVLTNNVNSLIVDIGNPADLSSKILTCLQNHELRERLVENAYRDVKDNYDIKIIVNEFGNIMNTTLCSENK